MARVTNGMEVTIEPGAGSRQGPERAANYVAVEQNVWRPPASLRRKLPKDFELALRCYIDADGVRRFAPIDCVEDFIIKAACAGGVLLSVGNGMSKELRQSYRAMQLFFQLGPRLREHLDRNFKHVGDLHIGGMGSARESILPGDLGLDHCGRGRPWSPNRLMKEGREAAMAYGHRQADSAACIRFGLLEAARRNPLKPDTSEKCFAVVRLGLFDLGPESVTLSEADIERVQKRLLVGLWRHLGDDPEAFNDWYFKKFDSIVKAISTKRHPDGPIANWFDRRSWKQLCVPTDMSANA